MLKQLMHKSFSLAHLKPIIPAMMAVWVLALVLLPVALWTWGESVLYPGIVSGVLAQTGVVVLVLIFQWGWKQTILRSIVLVGLAWLAEFTGSNTGIPFGTYEYTPALQPQLGSVPLIIPLAWLMMLPPAWAVAQRITGLISPTDGRERLRFAVVSAAAMTAWDLFLDPQMVGWGIWVWEQPGRYFGIPLVNFFGWFLVSALITLIINPNNLPVFPLTSIYIITWILETIGLSFFWEMPGPASIGFLGMGIFVGLTIWKTNRKSMHKIVAAAQDELPGER